MGSFLFSFALVSANPCEIVRHISPAWLRGQNKAQAATYLTNPQLRIVHRMVQKLGFESVASGRIIRDHNGNYTHQLSMGDPTDQMDSGRCWIFAGCNAVRTMSLNRKLLPQGFQFSETYLYFYSMLEKANFYMNKVASEIERGSNPNLIRNLEDPGMDDGGWWA